MRNISNNKVHLEKHIFKIAHNKKHKCTPTGILTSIINHHNECHGNTSDDHGHVHGNQPHGHCSCPSHSVPRICMQWLSLSGRWPRPSPLSLCGCSSKGTSYLNLYPPNSCIPYEPPISNLPFASEDCDGCYSFYMNRVWGRPHITPDNHTIIKRVTSYILWND